MFAEFPGYHQGGTFPLDVAMGCCAESFQQFVVIFFFSVIVCLEFKFCLIICMLHFSRNPTVGFKFCLPYVYMLLVALEFKFCHIYLYISFAWIWSSTFALHICASLWPGFGDLSFAWPI